MKGLIGKKIGMTRIFSEDTGQTIPVTVIQTGVNVVHQIKTVTRDGYDAVQLGFGHAKENKMPRAEVGHSRKHGAEPVSIIREFAMDEGEELTPGQKIGPEMLEGVKYVDVIATSKGRGFTGTIKRHNFQRGRETHGNTNHRDRGSLGAGTFPARVFPGVKMAGHYGNERVTVKGLEVVKTDTEAGLVFVKGAIPGPRRGIVMVRKNMTKK